MDERKSCGWDVKRERERRKGDILFCYFYFFILLMRAVYFVPPRDGGRHGGTIRGGAQRIRRRIHSKTKKGSIVTGMGTPNDAHATLLNLSLSPQGGGWLSWLGGRSSTSSQSQQAKTASIFVRKCIENCGIPLLIRRSSTIQPDSLVFFVKAMILASVKPRHADGDSRYVTSIKK